MIVLIIEKVEQKTIEVPSKFIYYTDLELNQQILRIAMNGASENVYEFFDVFTSNREVTKIIFQESLLLDVPIVPSFSLAWGESKYKIKAINKNVDDKGVVISIDRGLYQLNNVYRKKWTEADFFNPQKNTHEGLTLFKQSLEGFRGEIVLSYGGYNKGIVGLKNGEIPFRTIAHVSNLIDYERDMEIKLNYFIDRWEHGQEQVHSDRWK
jgi:hypothetical protein